MALAMLSVATGVFGNTSPPPGEPMTLSRALSEALLNNPTLKAYGFEDRIAEARVIQAGIRPNPELSFKAENLLGTNAMSGVKGLETTLQLSQVIDLGGSISQKVATAQSARALAKADYEIKRLDILAEVGRRFTEVAADSERLKSARRASEIGRQAVEAVQQRVDAAVSSPIELLKVRTTLTRLQIEEEHAEHELIAHRQHLASVLGQEEASFGTISADLLALPAVPKFSTLAKRLENSPVLSRFAVEQRWREAQMRLAQSLRRSGATLSGGLRRNEVSGSFGLVAGISIPLAVREVNAGNIREARERRDQLDASADALRLEMRATLFEVYQEMLHARTAMTLLQEELLPTAQQILTLADEGYRSGRFALLDLLNAQKSLIELQRLLVSEAATYHLHVIEIERLLGAPIHDAEASS